MSLPPSPSADEKLIADANTVLAKWIDREEMSKDQAAIIIHSLRDALLAAHRRNDQHVAAYDEVAQKLDGKDALLRHLDLVSALCAAVIELTRERDSALRACADERERCATLREACEVAKVWMKTMFDEMHAKEGFSLSLTALTQDRAFIQAALDGALPLPALAEKQEMPDRKDTRDELSLPKGASAAPESEGR